MGTTTSFGRSGVRAPGVGPRGEDFFDKLTQRGPALGPIGPAQPEQPVAAVVRTLGPDSGYRIDTDLVLL